LSRRFSTHHWLDGAAWWIFFKWLKDSSLWLSSVPLWLFQSVITHLANQLHSFYVQLIIKLIWSVIYHTLHSVYVQWGIKWTKISLACIVVLQDPMCQALQRQAKTYDIWCRILFDCQFPMLYHVFDSLVLWRYWSRQVPCAKLTRTQGFHLRLRLRCRVSRTHSLNTSEVLAGSACRPPVLLSKTLRGPFKSSNDFSSAAPQESATPAGEFYCPRSVSSMFSCGFTAPEISDLHLVKVESSPSPSILDALLLFENPAEDFCRIRAKRQELLRSLKFSTSKLQQRLSALVACTELVKDLWPHSDVTAVRTQKVSFLSKGNTQCNTPVVLDTGASFSLTPFKADFVTPIVPTSSKEMKGITNSLCIQGVGTHFFLRHRTSRTT